MRHQEQRKMTRTKVEVKKMATRAAILMLEKKIQLAPKDYLIRVDTIQFPWSLEVCSIPICNISMISINHKMLWPKLVVVQPRLLEEQVKCCNRMIPPYNCLHQTMMTNQLNYQRSMVLLSLSHSVHSWLPSISLHLFWHIMHIENTRASQKMLLEEVLTMSMETSSTTLLFLSVKMINLKKRKN